MEQSQIWLVSIAVVAVLCALYRQHTRNRLAPGIARPFGHFALVLTGRPRPSLFLFAVEAVRGVVIFVTLPLYAYRAFVLGNTLLIAAFAVAFVLVAGIKVPQYYRRHTAGAAGSALPAVVPAAAPADPGTPSASKSLPKVAVYDEETDELQPEDDAADAAPLPSYWTNSRQGSGRDGAAFDQMVYLSADSHAVFEELLQRTYRPIATQDRPCPRPAEAGSRCAKTPGGCPCVRPGGDPGLPTAYVVRRVIRVEERRMWRRYARGREALRAKHAAAPCASFDPPVLTGQVTEERPETFGPLDSSVNEVYLWHGTRVRTALAIAQNDFDLGLAGSRAGTMYGQGAYLAESSTKADEYSLDEPGNHYDGVFALLLVRACMGRYFYTTTRDAQAGDRVAAGDYDSTLGDRAAVANTYREFVVYDADRVYPEFIVLYSHLHRQDDEGAVRAAAAAVPFHMELPVYWANCHLNPHVDTFRARYRVCQATVDLLQRLVAGTMTRRPPAAVVEAFRVEDSEMWSRYVEFKRQVTARQAATCVNSDSGGGGGRPAMALLLMAAPGNTTDAGSNESYVRLCASKELPAARGALVSLRFSCEWKDQDWGNKKGQVKVVLRRHAGDAPVAERDLFGVCRSDGRGGWKRASRVLGAGDPVVARAAPGDRLEALYKVGGGGGHALHIRDFACHAQWGPPEDAAGQQQPQVIIARCRPPNELDGHTDTGHSLTTSLLQSLGAEDCISSENLDASINEMLLWHGTTPAAAEAISQEGFRIPRAERALHGKRFGEGAYLAEDLSKSASYAAPAEPGGLLCVLLCRVACGELYYTEEALDTQAHAKALAGGKDSVLANPEAKGPREFIVLDESQVYPEFIVKLRL